MMGEQAFFIAILSSAIIAGTPILYAALGELLTEKAGVTNLGVEGMMLIGAVSGFMATIVTGNTWLGLGAAAVAGGAMGLIHAVLTVSLRANQVVSGLALTLFGSGLSGYLGKAYIGIPVQEPFRGISLPLLGELPLLGPVLFRHDLLVYLSWGLVLALGFFLKRTRAGLVLQAVGENPGAADSLGIHVFALRYFYVIVGGALCGIGGAYLSLASAPSWLENMTAGRGWIAVALVIFALWRPERALVGAYLFGGIDALGFHLQAAGVQLSHFFLQMLPYLFTITVLTVVMARRGGRLAAPGALGLPYDREER
jgi:simple sugar transport system permease protein